MPKLVRNRPKLRPHQVEGIKNLRAGREYIIHDSIGKETRFRMSSGLPFQDIDGAWKAWVIFEGSTSEISLADAGITAYPDGRWNRDNWTEQVAGEPPAWNGEG